MCIWYGTLFTTHYTGVIKVPDMIRLDITFLSLFLFDLALYLVWDFVWKGFLTYHDGGGQDVSEITCNI